MCMFSLGDFLYLFFICLLGAGGVCGLLLNGIFFLGGGGDFWATLRLRLRLGIVSGVGYTQILNVFGACLIHIS